MTLCPKTSDLFLCSRFITGFLKNLCTPVLPSLSKIATFSMISNTEAETTLCRVPQGSVLGRLLFLLYINDIYMSSSLFAFYLFADDTSIILADNNLKELETLVNRELGNVNERLKANKLSLNIKKNQISQSFVPGKRIYPSYLGLEFLTP